MVYCDMQYRRFFLSLILWNDEEEGIMWTYMGEMLPVNLKKTARFIDSDG